MERVIVAGRLRTMDTEGGSIAMERLAQPRRRKADSQEGWWLRAAEFELLSERQRVAWNEKQERIEQQQRRYPPMSVTAEAALLGTLIYANRSRWKETTKQVPPEMFYDNWHRAIYRWLKSVENEPWRWTGDGQFASQLNKATREMAGYEGMEGVGWRLGKLVNHELATLEDLPGLVKTLRRLMVLRRKIAEAEKSLHEAWRQADAEEC